MRTEFPQIFTGSAADCTPDPPYTLIHACKSCHRRVAGQPAKTDPDYLSTIIDGSLYLNMIDPPLPLFHPRMFQHFLAYTLPIYQQGHHILIHCDQGESRSRSLALLLGARVGLLPTSDYFTAAAAFEEITQTPYVPGQGLMTFLDQHWHRLLA